MKITIEFLYRFCNYTTHNSLPYRPGQLCEVVGLEDELLQLPQPPDLVGDRVQLVLLQVEDPELLQLTNVRREPSQKVVREYQNLKLV